MWVSVVCIMHNKIMDDKHHKIMITLIQILWWLSLGQIRRKSDKMESYRLIHSSTSVFQRNSSTYEFFFHLQIWLVCCRYILSASTDREKEKKKGKQRGWKKNQEKWMRTNWMASSQSKIVRYIHALKCVIDCWSVDSSMSDVWLFTRQAICDNRPHLHIY